MLFYVLYLINQFNIFINMVDVLKYEKIIGRNKFSQIKNDLIRRIKDWNKKCT